MEAFAVLIILTIIFVCVVLPISLAVSARAKANALKLKLELNLSSIKEKLGKQGEQLANLEELVKELHERFIKLEKGQIGEIVPEAAPAEQVAAAVRIEPVEEIEQREVPFAAIHTIVPPVTPETQVSPEAPIGAGESVAEEVTAGSSPKPIESISSAPLLAEKGGFESKLGPKIFIWGIICIGTVALAFAGIFLVNWAIDHGYIGPTVRVALGILFGIALLWLGEWIRNRSLNISQGLSAAGIAVLFASFLAAMNLYHLISNTVGFIFLVLTTAVAVLLSLRQGPLIAVIGLIGGFFTPYWVRTGIPKPVSLFSYLFLLESGLLVVTRKKRWWYLAALTLLGAIAWVVIWLDVLFKPEHSLWISLFLIFTVAIFLLSGLRKITGALWEETRIISGMNYAAVACGAVLMAILVGINDFGNKEWIFLSLISVACLVLARRLSAYMGLAWFASIIIFVLMLVWASTLTGSVERFFWILFIQAILFSIGSYLLLWKSETPVTWAALSTVSAITFFLIGYWCHVRTKGTFHWGIVCIIAAAVYVILAIPVVKKLKLKELVLTREGTYSLALMSVAVTFFIALAIPIELKKEWLSVAWSLQVLALVWIASKLNVPALRKLSIALIILVMFRLVLNSEILKYPIGTFHLVNWLLYGYGIPILSFILAAYLASGDKSNWLTELLNYCTIALAAVFITLQIHHSFHVDDFSQLLFTFAEWGTFLISWLIYALLLMYLSNRLPFKSIVIGGQGILIFSLAGIYAVLIFAKNPLFNDCSVGKTIIFNQILYAYGISALLVILFSQRFFSKLEKSIALACSFTCLVLLFWLVTLEIRQAFQGEYLAGGTAMQSEKYAYSIGWIAFGSILLLLGIIKKTAILRYGSIVVIFLAIGKVFLYDTAQLKDLYRVLSYFGLGVCLIVIAYLYQKFVFKK